MQIVWRTLPKLALPAALGLGVAYLATSFVPRPAPSLRPPEELRAQGQAFGEESPVRVILERNVLQLESPPFYPVGLPPAPIVAPAAVAPPPAPARAAFAQADTSVAPQGSSPQAATTHAPGGAQGNASLPLSGGHSVQGLAARPAQGTAQDAVSGSNGSRQPVPPGALGANIAPAPGAAPAAKALAGASTSKTRPEVLAKTAVADGQAPAQQAAPRLGLEGFRLVGVIAGGEHPMAMLQVDGAAVSLRLGEQARGWTLVSVELGQVLLKNGEQQRRLVLGSGGPAQHPKAP